MRDVRRVGFPLGEASDRGEQKSRGEKVHMGSCKQMCVVERTVGRLGVGGV